MSTKHEKENQIQDLLVNPDGEDRPSNADEQQILDGFLAMDGIQEEPYSEERLIALRNVVMLDIAPDQAELDLHSGVMAVEHAANVAFPVVSSALRQRVLRSVFEPFGWKDELLWAVSAIAVVAGFMTMMGAQASPKSFSDVTVTGLVLYLAAAALVGLHFLRIRGVGSSLGALLAGVAGIGFIEWLGASSSSAGVFDSGIAPAVRAGMMCLVMGSLVGLFAALPLVIHRGGLPWHSAAMVGAVGGLVGAAMLHIQCPATATGHSVVFHSSGALVAALATAMFGKLILVVRDRMRSTTPNTI